MKFKETDSTPLTKEFKRARHGHPVEVTPTDIVEKIIVMEDRCVKVRELLRLTMFNRNPKHVSRPF